MIYNRNLRLVYPAWYLEGAINGLFLLILATVTLALFSRIYRVIALQPEGLKVLREVMPMPHNEFQFGITHSLLFAILIALLSMTSFVINKKEKSS